MAIPSDTHQTTPSPTQDTAAYLDSIVPKPAHVEAKSQVDTNMQSDVSSQSDSNDAHIKSQLRHNQDKLNDLDPVADIRIPDDYSQMDRASKLKWIENKLRPTGYTVDRKGFGIIEFAMKHIKKAIRYFKVGSVEEAAFEAIPYVLENGRDISSHSNHKGRNYDTITIAAPVIINGSRGNMAVVVKQTDGNRYKVHRILTPDGSVFKLSEETSEAESTTAGGVTVNGSLATPKDSASSDSIRDPVQIVNPSQDLASYQESQASDTDNGPNPSVGNAGQSVEDHVASIVPTPNQHASTSPVDTDTQTNYNNTTTSQGGMIHGGHNANTGAQVHGTAGEGIRNVPGRAAVNSIVQGRRDIGQGDLRKTGELFLIPSVSGRLAQTGKPNLPMWNATAQPQQFIDALNEARAADAKNGWCAASKLMDEMIAPGLVSYLAENGAAGFLVTADGDIEAVFANKSKGAPKGIADSLMLRALSAGGNRLDCYREVLAKMYSKYGFSAHPQKGKM